MTSPVFERLVAWLDTQDVAYRVRRHAAAYTSEEAAAVRGVPLSTGAKALVCKGDDGFVLCVLPADRRLHSNAVRRARRWRGLRFATEDELLALTGLRPGAVPPFGSLFSLPTLCDRDLPDNEVMNFTAGDHELSISMSPADYVRVERPELLRVGR
ncbi:MAG: hypothetical protein H6825_03180 [Planctomycetes bacterium]|nr:hypothetical protein [Planctomycetota bacterium]